jgi:hypothetical protein
MADAGSGNTNTGQDAFVIARSALELSFTILRRLAVKGLITKDDMGHIHASAFPAASSGAKHDVDAFAEHVRVRLAELQSVVDAQEK